jgi:aminopeptidase
MDQELLDRYADLIVRFGANVQPGQEVRLLSTVGKQELTRAIATRLYQVGAVFVSVRYDDSHLDRARLDFAVDEALSYEPEWIVQMIRDHGTGHGATIGLSGNPWPGLLEGVDPERIARDHTPGRKELRDNLAKARNNWTLVPAPTEGWAVVVHPDLEPADALARLWEQVIHMCRLDEEDPVVAWEARIEELNRVKATLEELHLDSLHFDGPGTDLTIGLFPGSRWHGGFLTTETGLVHHPNLPTEEVFTTPDPERTEGVIRGSRPRELEGSIIRDFTLRFEGGRLTGVEAEAGGEALAAWSRRDDGAARLGEVALVDSSGRVGPLDTIFYDTLIDENAASHIAIGQGFDWAVGEDERPRINRSEVHIDLMVGRPETTVTGITADGSEMPLLLGGNWQI